MGKVLDREIDQINEKLATGGLTSVVEAEEKKEIMEKKPVDEEVDIEFFNLENPGLYIKFVFGDTRKKKSYTLFHGGKYKLPRSVIKHLSTRQMPIWNYISDGTGHMQKNLMAYRSRFECRQVW
jgi:hypothetical protein